MDTHIKIIEAIEIAIHTNINILCLPAHTSHRLPPLNVALSKHIAIKK